MPVGPTFEPHGEPGGITRSYFEAAERTQSMMERASRMRRESERSEMENRVKEILLPVAEAKARADLIDLNAKVEMARQQQNDRAVAMAILPEAQHDFSVLMATRNPDFKEELAYNWLGAYSHLDSVGDPAMSGDIKAKKDIIGKVILEQQTIRKLKEQGDINLQMLESRLGSAEDIARGKAEIEQEKIEIQREREQMRKEIEELKAETSIKRATISAEARAPSRSGITPEFRRSMGIPEEASVAPAAPSENKSEATVEITVPEDRLYTVSEGMATFGPKVKTPEDVVNALKQMVADGLVDPDQAIAVLEKLGLRPKNK